jgi:DNA-3-methyladenine glycosylase II
LSGRLLDSVVTEPSADAHEFLRADDAMAPLVAEYGELDLDPAEDLFRRTVVSILRQQVSMASAAATRERLFEAVEPTPESVLAAEPERLREAGLSRQKTRYVRELARTFREEDYEKAALADLEDEAIRDRLTAVTGVGEWTANMQLLFTFGREDVFPVGDLGVREGMATLFDVDREDREWMVEAARRWAPYRSYATLYCWRVEEDIADAVAEVVDR